ncbi:hypothetical protein NDU88_003969 [Pleurodeles waltl]|uniref:Uncharacterized protein n=1 Tax=Pleurodeles waltl TaxID=8319 RepID=A0AAV7UE13_PLEWA|nr:hypothetical protein NDU88_003969 [Pleurodeles waltl]
MDRMKKTTGLLQESNYGERFLMHSVVITSTFSIPLTGECVCDGPRNLDLGRKYPGGTADGILAEPEEAGVVEHRIRENDVEPRGVLNPEQDEGEEETFSSGGEGVTMKESGMDGPASELHPGRRRGGGEVPINPDAETVEDVRKERRSGQTTSGKNVA